MVRQVSNGMIQDLHNAWLKKHVIEKIPVFPLSQSICGLFFEIPVKLTQTATPPSQKTSFQASNTSSSLVPPNPCTYHPRTFLPRNMARCTKIWCPKLPQVTSWSPEGSHNIASIASLCSWMKVSSFGCVLNWTKAPNKSSKLFYHCQVIYIYRVSFLGGRSYFIYFQMLFMRPSFANLKYMNTYTPSNLTQTTTISPEKIVLAKNI